MNGRVSYHFLRDRVLGDNDYGCDNSVSDPRLRRVDTSIPPSWTGTRSTFRNPAIQPIHGAPSSHWNLLDPRVNCWWRISGAPLRCDSRHCRLQRDVVITCYRCCHSRTVHLRQWRCFRPQRCHCRDCRRHHRLQQPRVVVSRVLDWVEKKTLKIELYDIILNTPLCIKNHKK